MTDIREIKIKLSKSGLQWTVDNEGEGDTLAEAIKNKRPKGEFPCPVCKWPLAQLAGEKLHPGDPKFGVTLTCMNLKCPPQEVMGHGSNAKNAYEVVLQRFKHEKED